MSTQVDDRNLKMLETLGLQQVVALKENSQSLRSQHDLLRALVGGFREMILGIRTLIETIRLQTGAMLGTKTKVSTPLKDKRLMFFYQQSAKGQNIMSKSFDAYTQSILPMTSQTALTKMTGGDDGGGIKGFFQKIFGKLDFGGADFGRGTGTIQTLGGLAASPFRAGGMAAKKMGGELLGSLAKMGPQMALLAVATQPVMAFLQAFLAPLEFLSDIFAMFGDILGLLFMPVMELMVPLFLKLVPPMFDLVIALTPMITMFVQIMLLFSGFTIVIEVLVVSMTVISAVFKAIEPVFTAVSIAIEAVNTAIGTLSAMFIDWLKPLFDGLKNAFEAISDALSPFISKVQSLIDLIKAVV